MLVGKGHWWLASAMGDAAMKQDLLLAELQTLRSELNSVIDRMNSNENFCAGTVSAIFAFMVSTGPFPMKFALALAGALVLLIGVRRYFELRQHTRKLDKYLMAAEKEVNADGGGWTCYYYESIRGSTTGGYSTTRLVFWAGLAIIVGLCFCLALMKYPPAVTAVPT